MKHKVYTIEFGIFWFYQDKLYRECKNQPSFLNIKEANEELENYLKWSYPLFSENTDTKKHLETGYYIELYENEVDLKNYEIKLIKEENDYPDGTSLSNPIREIFIDNSGKLVQY